MKTHSKLALLASLYFSQGLPFGFFTQAMPAFLRREGVALEYIGLFSLLALPWAFKFLWAPLVDNTSPLPHLKLGRRRSWIIPLQLLTVALLSLLAFLNPEHELGIFLLCTGIFTANLLAATQDIATDGLAVSILSPSERGLGNGLQVAGYRVGMIAGGSALLVAFEYIGWNTTFLIMASLLFLASTPILSTPEPPPHQPPPTHEHKHGLPQQPLSQHIKTTVRAFFTQPRILPWLTVLVIYKAGDAMAQGMLRPYMIDLDLSLSDIGVVVGGVGFATGLLGALIGGWATQRIGRPRALLTFGVLQALSIALYIIPIHLQQPSWVAFLIPCALEHLAGGMATAALFTWMMDICNPDQGGTDYTIQASVVVLSTGVATALSGVVASAVGYTAHFAISAAISLLGVLLIAFLKLPTASTPSQRPKDDGIGVQGSKNA